jgi:hypothetical protein
VKSVSIYLENSLCNGDVIEIFVGNSLFDNEQVLTLGISDFNTGWYELPFKYNDINDKNYLIITADGLKGSVGIGVTDTDFMNIGECTINDNVSNKFVAFDIKIQISNKIWDNWSFILIAFYCVGAAIGVFISNMEIVAEKKGRILFVFSIVLNSISLFVVFPYFLENSYIAENSLNFYYLTQKYNITESLLKMDAGYLPLAQRLIAIFYIRVLGLGTHSLYFMQLTGMIIDIIILSMFNLNIFRGRVHSSLRFGLSLCLFIIFVNPTMSTYFNFIYLGYFLILMLLTCDLNEFKRCQFVLMCVVSGIICMSKGFYAVMLPLGIIEILLFGNIAGKRKNIYAFVIAVTAGLEVGYAFILGNAAQKWLGGIWSLMSWLIPIMIVLIIVLAFVLSIVLKCWNKIPIEWKHQYMDVILLCLSLIGSLAIGTVAFRKIDLTNLFNWGNAWYVPAAMALFLLLCECAGMVNNDISIRRRFVSGVLYVAILGDVLMSLFYSRDKQFQYSYACVPWNIYSEYFNNTVVPVFIYDQRFGTLSDECTLWYTNDKPVDNYAYGAPYGFEYLENNESENEYTDNFQLYDIPNDQTLSAVYLNYLNNIGNAELKVVLYDKDDNIVGTLNQITPLSSRTIGFVSDEGIGGVAYLKVITVEGEAAQVTKNAYFITK